jgi:anti-anti-sigma factor
MYLDPAAAGTPHCTICVQRRDGWTAVLLRGELDLAAVDQLTACVRTELGRRRPLLLELAGLEFCDAAGVRAIAELRDDGESCEPPGGVEIHGARGQVLGLMRAMGLLDRVVPEGPSALR